MTDRLAAEAGSPLVDPRTEEPTHVVEMRAITKRFGTLVANDGIDLALAKGEVHALLGENGAGKTTLMNLLFGMLRPDDGEIVIRGEPCVLHSPRDALARRVGMVHQHFMLVPDFTIAENVVLGTRSAWNMRLRRKEIEREVGEVAERFGIHLAPDQPVSELSIDVQQRVEILKLLYVGADVLILDEPTAVLGPTEIDHLFDTLRSLAGMGAAVVIITHKLREVMSVADRVTVLRHGKVATQAAKGQFDERDLALAMLGRELPPPPQAVDGRRTGAVVLQAHDLHVAGDRSEDAVTGVDLVLREGEIVGMAGVEGNGQVELCQAFCGLRHPHRGTIEMDGVELTGRDPADFHGAGIGVVSDDRLKWDIVADLSLADNLALSSVRAGRYSRWGLLRRRAIRRDAQRLLEEYDVRPPNPDTPAGRLSGGNQQKVVIARECSARPRALIASHPTRGLDVGASEFVYRRLAELRAQGCAVLLNSTDLDELLGLSDRLIVLFRGRIVLDADARTLDVGRVAAAMAGVDA